MLNVPRTQVAARTAGRPVHRVKIYHDTWKRLCLAAAAREVSQTALARALLERGLDELEVYTKKGGKDEA
jgi:hypothetical protein